MGYFTNDGMLIYAGGVSRGMPLKLLTDLRADATR
jgi:hypothetical protein